MENSSSGTEMNFGYPDYLHSPDDDPVMAQVCRLLEHGEITECDLLYSGSNYVFFVSLANGEKQIRGIYKPRRGEAPLWDFPDGTLYKREYASFVISEALSWSLVPPTVIRNGPHGIGSIQFFIDTGRTTDYDSLDVKYLPVLKQVALFDCLVNNADRKSGHCMEGRDGRLWILDHGLTFNSLPKLRTVIWEFSGQSIPKNLISDVLALKDKLKSSRPLREVLSRLLTLKEAEALGYRIQEIIDNPVFPYPVSHRSIPWPWW